MCVGGGCVCVCVCGTVGVGVWCKCDMCGVLRLIYQGGVWVGFVGGGGVCV